ncbi:MAG: redoxin [Bacteroidetes bacterium RBG_13_42_15]|jgi:thiol-disulfide isomerase/thioredoxin|nr:MAG: redoxin [Bacteroidetes bacterium RBG_13_42_15]
MKKLLIPLLTLLPMLLCSAGVSSQTTSPEPKTIEPGSKAPDFSLLGVDGKNYSLRDFDKAKVLVIIFSCNHCPTAQAYEDRIISIAGEYKPKGVDIVMISPNSGKALNYSELGYSDMGDSYEDMRIRAADKKFPFPYLYDGDDQKSALDYGPVATPHCFVFDSDRILRYAGRVDGSEKPGTGKGEDLRNAIDAVIAGLPVKNPVTKVFGCSIKWSWKSEYTQKLYKQWSELPVNLEEIDEQGIKDLIKNTSSGKLRLINFWATWCGPCITEFPDLVIIDRMYRQRAFEFITVSVDKQARKTDALNFLQKQEASNKNYIFNDDDVYRLIEVVDNDWQGALPFTLLIEPGGKILYKKQDMIDPLEMKKLIVGNKVLGRYY